MALPDLHDATLTEIEVDWPRGVATVSFRLAAGHVRVVLSTFREIVLPRREEWGRSASVLIVRHLDDTSGYGLVVEMQSGDRLIIDGEIVVVETG